VKYSSFNSLRKKKKKKFSGKILIFWKLHTSFKPLNHLLGLLGTAIKHHISFLQKMQANYWTSRKSIVWILIKEHKLISWLIYFFFYNFLSLYLSWTGTNPLPLFSNSLSIFTTDYGLMIARREKDLFWKTKVIEEGEREEWEWKLIKCW